MEAMLILNGYEICGDVAEQEEMILAVASSQVSRDVFVEWRQTSVVPFTPNTIITEDPERFQ
jgi:prophage maintenance system killer protein